MRLLFVNKFIFSLSTLDDLNHDDVAVSAAALDLNLILCGDCKSCASRYRRRIGYPLHSFRCSALDLSRWEGERHLEAGHCLAV